MAAAIGGPALKLKPRARCKAGAAAEARSRSWPRALACGLCLWGVALAAQAQARSPAQALNQVQAPTMLVPTQAPAQTPMQAPMQAPTDPLPRSTNTSPAPLDWSSTERAVIASFGPWPTARRPDAANRRQASPAVAAYGRRLFFDVGLSADGRLSCASCHEPGRAFQDGRAVAQGRGAGIRNTPSLLDVAERRWFGWDGRHDSLWAASLAPLVDPREMATRIETLAALVRGDAKRQAAHCAVFGAPLPVNDLALVVQMAKALAAYQGTLRSPRTAFDRFRDALVRGDARAAARYPLAAQRGLRLFIGEARCAVCHAGPAFTNDEFADIGVPFFVARGGADAGRHGGLERLLASPFNRLGDFNDANDASATRLAATVGAASASMATDPAGRRVPGTGVAGAAGDPRSVLTRHLKIEPRHFGEFRVPSLRQLTRTAPYMHNGSLPTLQDVVGHYNRLDEERLHADGERILRRLNLSEAQTADLVAFLRTL